MRKIAEKIEYSPTAIYFHFKDKEALLRELCDTDFGALAHEFQKIARIADPVERLRQIGRAYVDFAIASPQPLPAHVHDAAAQARCGPRTAASPAATRRRTPTRSCARRSPRRSPAGGCAPELSDADLVSQMVWAGTHGVVSLHIAKCNDDWIDWRDARETAHAADRRHDPRPRPRGELTMVDLATKSLLHDKLRFLITVSGVAFAVTLVFVQVGLFLGLLDNASVTIEHIDADLWVTSRNTPNVDFAHTFPRHAVKRVRSVPGVARADNLIVWFMTVTLPSGAQEGTLVYALEDFRRWNIPWNVEQGDLDDLKRGQYFFLDDSAVKRYGAVRGRASTARSSGQRLKIIGRTRDARSFTTTPISFIDFERAQTLSTRSRSRARRPTSSSSSRRAPTSTAVKAEIAPAPALQRRLHRRRSGPTRSRSYWVESTGIGLNMYITVFLGCLVGIVVVAQTLYTSTMEHIKEFGTVKAIGGGNLDIYRILGKQASIAAVVGFLLGALMAYAMRPVIAKIDLKLIITPAFAAIVFVGSVADVPGRRDDLVPQGRVDRSGAGVSGVRGLGSEFGFGWRDDAVLEAAA